MRTFALMAAALALFATPAEAAMQIVNGTGQLTGATGVIVDGVSYDVTFAEGSCNSQFGGCNAANFAFSDKPTALDAAQALLDQVFLDVAQGNFDSDEALTFGCQVDPQDPGCNVLVPYFSGGSPLSVDEAGALNYSVGACCTDFVFAPFGGPADQDTAGVNSVYAVFARSPVPEPASWAMILLGFAGIGLAMRWRRGEVERGLSRA